MAAESEMTMTLLPEELVYLEILTRLPGKELGRCKCVCKSWRSAIKSRHFSDTYRNRNRCLMLYWSETTDYRENSGRLRFYYSPLRRVKDDTEDFKQLHKLPFRPYQYYMSDQILTQLVNGLICVKRSRKKKTVVQVQLTIHSVCTGESMKIPELQEYSAMTSLFHLGYDPASRTYKLLRLVFWEIFSIFPGGGPYRRLIRVDIMTLRPSTSVSEWRTLDTDTAEFRRLKAGSIYSAIDDGSVRMFSGDGVLCWISEMVPPPEVGIREQGIIVFDLNSEKFRSVKFPRMFGATHMVLRAQINKQDLTLSLWGVDVDFLKCVSLEDDEGEKWSERCLSLPEELQQPVNQGAVRGSFSGDDGIMVMSANSTAVYGCTTQMDERHWVGKIPAEVKAPRLFSQKKKKKKAPRHPRIHRSQLDNSSRGSGLAFGGRLSCLLDSCDLYRSLDEVLSGTF